MEGRSGGRGADRARESEMERERAREKAREPERERAREMDVVRERASERDRGVAIYDKHPACTPQVLMCSVPSRATTCEQCKLIQPLQLLLRQLNLYAGTFMHIHMGPRLYGPPSLPYLSSANSPCILQPLFICLFFSFFFFFVGPTGV